MTNTGKKRTINVINGGTYSEAVLFHVSE